MNVFKRENSKSKIFKTKCNNLVKIKITHGKSHFIHYIIQNIKWQLIKENIKV